MSARLVAVLSAALGYDPLVRADHHAVDLHHKLRKEIDWNRVHILADRRAPFALQHPLTKREICGGKS